MACIIAVVKPAT